MKANYNRMLQRQIRRFLKDEKLVKELAPFLDAINQSYQHYESEAVMTQRSLEVSSEELMQKNRELERQNEMLESFVYRVTHDLKSPAQNIGSLIGVLETTLDEADPISREVMHHLKTSSGMLVQRIKDLLDMTRTKYFLDQEAVELFLPDLFHDVISSIDTRIENIEVEITPDFSTLSVVHFPKENLFSILQNLISNAIKYHRPGFTPKIKVKSGIIDGRCFIEVQDNGLGIDLEKNGDKLFQMYSRFHDHVEGSGIGLFVLKKIMDDSGGSVEVESELNKGSRFIVWFKNIQSPEKA